MYYIFRLLRETGCCQCFSPSLWCAPGSESENSALETWDFANICCCGQVKLDAGLSGIHAIPETDMWQQDNVLTVVSDRQHPLEENHYLCRCTKVCWVVASAGTTFSRLGRGSSNFRSPVNARKGMGGRGGKKNMFRTIYPWVCFGTAKVGVEVAYLQQFFRTQFFIYLTLVCPGSSKCRVLCYCNAASHHLSTWLFSTRDMRRVGDKCNFS